MTGVRQSSLEAYQKLIDSGQIGKQAGKILTCLLKSGEPMTLQEIRMQTGIDINAVSGRVNGLKRSGYIIEAPRRQCSITGRIVIPVQIR